MNARTFSWSVRRELWEHRAIWIGPLAVAVLAVAGILVNLLRNTDKMRAIASLTPAKQAAAIAMPYSLSAAAVIFIGFVVAAFYCIDALNAERRDRSILFWKSMPVSDLETVASKAFVAMVLSPLIAFAIALATQLLLLVIINGVRLAIGMDLAMPRLVSMTIEMLYGVVVHMLWYAPLYAWLLLVSAWAKRGVFLWVLLPPIAIGIVEGLAFDSSRFMELLTYRFRGAMQEAWAVDALNTAVTELSQLAPLKFLGTPGLPLGLAFAAACLYAAVRLRRHREPI